MVHQNHNSALTGMLLVGTVICTTVGNWVRARLAETRAIFRLHYTPTYVSRLNQVGHWFALVTREAIRRGSFTSVPDLIAHTERCVARHNQHPVLFACTATAESILAKVRKYIGLYMRDGTSKETLIKAPTFGSNAHVSQPA